MRGEILYFDDERGVGFITGDDGNRYHFAAADLSPGHRARKGSRVDFTLEGDHARGVAVEGAAVAAPQAATPIAPAAPATASSVPRTRTTGPVAPAPVAGIEERQTGLFGHFRRAVTGRYADFRSRATRTEYWSFVLFFIVTMVALSLVGVMLDLAAGNLDDEAPFFTMALAGLTGIALFLPGLAVTVRRIHDIGLSGWFALLGLIPSVGSLIILVFSLIPSQKHENRWGPPPAGLA